eukprot:Skav200259  [mRNA]  locus=scaffold128:285689:290281:+ [translate_table: standard]
MQFLSHRGFESVATLYHRRTGRDLPPTFGTSTCNDVALLSPDLASLIDHVHVETPGPFAGHHPLCFSLNFGKQSLYRYGWTLPRPWIGLEPDKDQVGHHFDNLPLPSEAADSSACPLQQWAQRLEQAVDHTIRARHVAAPEQHPSSTLPRSYRGRCRPRKLVFRPLPSSIRQACQGQYTPATDLRTIGLGQRTKQLRRIQSLKFLAMKHHNNVTPRVMRQMHLEWKAIMSSTGYPGGFLQWCQMQAPLCPVPHVFPSIEWLQQAESQVLGYLQTEVTQHQRKQRDHLKYIQAQDLKKYGKQAAYAHIRGPTAGLIQHVPATYEVPVTLVNRPMHGLVQVQLPPFASVDLTHVIRLDAHDATVIDWKPPVLEVMMEDAEVDLPSTLTLSQACTTSEPLAMAKELTAHWDKYWNPADHDAPDKWDAFHNMLSHVPQLPDIQVRALFQNEVSLDIVPNARELGYTVHYKAKQSRSTQHDRQEQTLQRLKRLQKLEIDLDTKAELITTSCLSKALYGTSMYVLGERHFAQLRTAIARALLGSHHNIQPYLATMCMSKKLIDPELTTVKMALLHARDFLMFAQPDQQTTFLHLAATFSKMPGQASGPATALTCYLAKVTWFIDRAGTLETPFDVPLHLLNSNVEDLLFFLEHSWMLIVADQVNTRQGMRGAPAVNRPRTLKAFGHITPEFQITVGLDMTGGYMLNGQKQKFADLPDDACVYCSQPDSHSHRVLECPATGHIRTTFPEVTEFLEEHETLHTILPLHYQHPETSGLWAMLYCLPEPEFTPHANARLIFTDGSCLNPHSVDHRIAAYAVVSPTVSDDELFAYRTAPAAWLLQHCFHVHAVALVTGRQTINRAELTAVVLAYEHGRQPVVTDSQFVIQQLQLVRSVSDVRALHKHGHYDLLRRLHNLHWDQAHDMLIQKVKSHQSTDITDRQEAILRIGNAVADHAASLGVRHLAKPLTSRILQIHREEDTMTDLLMQQYQMRGLFGKHRAHLDKPEQQQWDYRDPERQTEDFQTWMPQTIQTFALPEDYIEVCHASRCGSDYSHLILQWLAGLQWPQEPDMGTPPTGITWLELALNFWVTTGLPPKVNTAASGQLARYVQLATSDEYLMSDFTFLHMSIAFQNCVKHVQYLAGIDLLPSQEPVRVRSLYLLGAGIFKQGLRFRPHMPCQSQTFQILRDYITQNATDGKVHFVEIPDIPAVIPLYTSQLAVEGDTLQRRSARYHQRRVGLRARGSAM